MAVAQLAAAAILAMGLQGVKMDYSGIVPVRVVAQGTSWGQQTVTMADDDFLLEDETFTDDEIGLMTPESLTERIYHDATDQILRERLIREYNVRSGLERPYRWPPPPPKKPEPEVRTIYVQAPPEPRSLK